MNIQAATAQISAIASEIEAAGLEPDDVLQTVEYEARLGALVEREIDAVLHLAAIPASGLPDLFVKINELARWRVQEPDGMCLTECLDDLVDSIIADAARLQASR